MSKRHAVKPVLDTVKCYDFPWKASTAHGACSPLVRPSGVRKPAGMHFPRFVGSRLPRSPASVHQCATAKLSQPCHSCWTTPGHGHVAVKGTHNCVTVFSKTDTHRQERPVELRATFYTFARKSSSISQEFICSSTEIPPNKPCWNNLFSPYPLFDINMWNLSFTRRLGCWDRGVNPAASLCVLVIWFNQPKATHTHACMHLSPRAGQRFKAAQPSIPDHSAKTTPELH